MLGKEHPFTALVLKLEGKDPDDAFSIVPYEKGHSLLMYLEQLLGGPGIKEHEFPLHLPCSNSLFCL